MTYIGDCWGRNNYHPDCVKSKPALASKTRPIERHIEVIFATDPKVR